MISDTRLAALAQDIKAWGRELGFAEVRIADIDLSQAEAGLQAWLEPGHHGEMDYMAAHGMKRARPAELVPGTLRVITARIDYLPPETGSDWREQEAARLEDPAAAVISVYARGRDYHKVLRARLQQLADPHRNGNRRLRLSRVHRFGAGDGSGAGGKSRPGLARQAHAAA